MDITPAINTLSQDLARAAHVGGEAVQEAAERLLLALDPALRLALLDVLSQAAGEIAAELPGVSISVRLEGREPVFAVVAPPTAEPEVPAAPAQLEPEPGEDAGDLARITLRIPEALKVRAEALATRRGQSLNTWLVAAARTAAALQDGPAGPSGGGDPSGYRQRGPGRRVQGWAR
ncbi:toxin-antitoxin system HicB family antitoxin [Caulobacter sp. KR2-114]|uniref:toxin-antitoxin system HicB family antitoxin n=1 Tax=Caulobacter sp. KR2-114 TaxID=3400912 RepID=UPI003C06895D